MYTDNASTYSNYTYCIDSGPNGCESEGDLFPEPYIGAGTMILTTSQLYGQASINPNFVYESIEGCFDTELGGPFPDKYGKCKPLPNGDERLPNSLGYCKYGFQTQVIDTDNIISNGDLNNYGYSVCNHDPFANTNDGSCVTNANGILGTDAVPFSAEQDDTYCDCFGHTEDCDNTCLSQHVAGVCSENYLDQNWYNTDFQQYADLGNGVGCGILACNGECIDPDTMINKIIQEQE